MTWFRVSVGFLAVSLLVAPTLAAVCPKDCVCNTTRDGLHRATCSSIEELYKFTLHQRHHNINILVLSHNNITKITHELDRLTEVVTLDLSTNGITTINKFLHNAKKLVHLNLANNRIKSMSLIHLPTSVSSLDLTNNLLQDVPSDLGNLAGLEHLELEGNPLHCSCDNLLARDQLLNSHVYIDNAKCASPSKFKDKSWLKLKTKDICKSNYFDMDMMMGDEPQDAIRIGEETTALKSMPLAAQNNLEDGTVIHPDGKAVDDDESEQFIRVQSSTSNTVSEIEGSGEPDSTDIPVLLEPIQRSKISHDLFANDEVFPAEDAHTTDDPIEGSGSGDGPFIGFGFKEFLATTTPIYEELNPGPVQRQFTDTHTDFVPPQRPTVYPDVPDWYTKAQAPMPVTTPKPATPQVAIDTTLSQHIRVTEVLERAPVEDDKPVPHKTGTYVCVAIIVVLLVGLIGFAIIKGQMRKRRDRRLLRQQKRDVEKASKEMVDMNKSLLGKPAVVEPPIDRKQNGKYELVPTHEATPKKPENGDMANGTKHGETNGLKADSPRDSNQNKNSSKDNNLEDQGRQTPPHETSFESDPASPDSRKDTHSLSSEDIFVPINDDETPSRLNGNRDSDISQPIVNGDQITDSDFLSPSREYVPVYSPDMGRVRIKMTETPKPKTPVLVNRSRSNAGDIIITPSANGGAPKSAT